MQSRAFSSQLLCELSQSLIGASAGRYEGGEREAGRDVIEEVTGAGGEETGGNIHDFISNLQEWQETTERRLIAEQKQELLRNFPQPVIAENDTEDDTTVTSMEFDNDNDSVMFSYFDKICHETLHFRSYSMKKIKLT